jgi:hypothetical protein
MLMASAWVTVATGLVELPQTSPPLPPTVLAKAAALKTVTLQLLKSFSGIVS